MPTDNLKALIDSVHESHYNDILLCCAARSEHKLLPEVDFKDPAICAFLASYIQNKQNS